MNIRITCLVILLSLACAGGLHAGNLLPNGDFSNNEDPFAHWMVDYAWTENSNYIANKSRVSLVRQDGTRRNVLRISAPPESKVETLLIPYNPKVRYRAKLDVKGSFTRIYFAGYRWKPGMRPHDNPDQGDMRMIYKSKAFTDVGKSWKTVTLEFPMKELSSRAKKHLSSVRYMSLYIWTQEGVSIDNINIAEIP